MKILVIRFSSIGDIIYTTPVVRCLKKQLPGAEVHFLTKPDFKFIYENNPYVDKLLLLKPTLLETVKQLRDEHYDYVIDLHNNVRTTVIKLNLRVRSSTYKKQRLLKWLSLKFSMELVPKVHLVDRYMQTVNFLGVTNDEQPIDYYLKANYQLAGLLPASHQNNFVAFIIGATHFTKRMPNEKIVSICKKINYPVILLGGRDVEANGLEIASKTRNVYNACGVLSLDQSVFLVSKAVSVIGFDTGLTHIAEAFTNPIVSVWGGTAPGLLGVQPYHVKDSLVAEIDLPCRPCSKFGLEKCPLGHFRCMNDMPESLITDFVNHSAGNQ